MGLWRLFRVLPQGVLKCSQVTDVYNEDDDVDDNGDGDDVGRHRWHQCHRRCLSMPPRQNFPTFGPIIQFANSLLPSNADFSDTILVNHLAAFPEKQSFTFAEKIAGLKFQFCLPHYQIKWCWFIIHAVIHISIFHSWKILSQRSERSIWQYFVQLPQWCKASRVIPKVSQVLLKKNADEILPQCVQCLF